MSHKQQALILSAPSLGDVHHQEREEFSGFQCTYCSGNGWFRHTDARGDSCKENCKVCRGSGRMKAVITVEWMPEEK